MKDSNATEHKDRRVKICGIFVNLSSSVENKAILAGEEIGLMQVYIYISSYSIELYLMCGHHYNSPHCIP